MSKRTSIYLTDASEQVIGPTDNLSGRINSIVGRYARILDESTPSLTEGEWSFLCDMLNGTVIEENTGDYLWADIAEAGKLNGLAEKWGVDSDDLSSRVRTMRAAARFAILEVVTRFWQNPGTGSLAAQLEKEGAKIKP